MSTELEEARPRTLGAGLLEAAGLVKSFGETRALLDGSLAVRSGEIHALLGENGSGKSTLVKLLSGVLRPDRGTLVVDGRPVTLRSPRRAGAAGIVTVFQEILIAPTLSVADNVCLGERPLRETRAQLAARRAVASDLLERLAPGAIDPDAPAGALGLMERQLCVIARALNRRPRLLILDEATSTLDITVRDRLFAALRDLCASGSSILFISHRMDEILELAHRATVLRAGAAVATVERDRLVPDELVRLMSGTRVAEARAARAATDHAARRVALEAAGVRAAGVDEPTSLVVHVGEIVGLAGLEGQGQQTFLEALAGLVPVVAGTIVREGVQIGSYRGAVRAGVVYIPRDRKLEGLAGGLTTLDNFALPTYEQDRVGGVVSLRRTRRRYDAFRDRLSIAAPPRRPAGRLSGGTQQKVILARWLAVEPRVVLLNDPTRGVDAATKLEIYALLEELVDGGAAVVMVSTEVEEHLSLMDRILVFRGGHATAEFARGSVGRETLVGAFFGHTSGDLA